MMPDLSCEKRGNYKSAHDVSRSFKVECQPFNRVQFTAHVFVTMLIKEM